MGVDYGLDDVTRDEEVIFCRYKHVESFMRMASPHLPANASIRAFDIHVSAYDAEDDWPVDEATLPFARDLADDFDLLAKAARKLEADTSAVRSDGEAWALRIFQSDWLEEKRDYCRAYPNSRMRGMLG